MPEMRFDRMVQTNIGGKYAYRGGMLYKFLYGSWQESPLTADHVALLANLIIDTANEGAAFRGVLPRTLPIVMDNGNTFNYRYDVGAQVVYYERSAGNWTRSMLQVGDVCALMRMITETDYIEGRVRA